MNRCTGTWESSFLGWNGIEFCFFLAALPIAFSGSVGCFLVLFIEVPILVKLLSCACGILFLKQTNDGYKFVRAAARSAKKITISDEGLVLLLFSSKRVVFPYHGYTCESVWDFISKGEVNEKLFPPDVWNFAITDGKKICLVSGNIDQSEMLFECLKSRSAAKLNGSI